MNLTGLMIAVLVAVGLYGGGYLHGRADGSNSVQVKWDKAESERLREEKQAVLDRIHTNLQEKKKQDRDKRLLKKGYADEIAAIHAQYAADRGLRVNANLCAGFAASPPASGPGGSDGGAATTRLLPEPYARNIDELMIKAEKIVAGCRVAQQFLIENGMAP